MEQLDYAIEFHILVTEEWGKGKTIAKPLPSEEEIEATENALNFTFPPSFRRFVARSPYFVGIQPDLNHHHSLVKENYFFHEETKDYYLPNFLILFMGGHDGDCICFDSRFRDDTGEVPVVYWDAESMTSEDIDSLAPFYPNFLEYLKFITEHKLNAVTIHINKT